MSVSFWTLNDLARFCKANSLTTFSAEQEKRPLRVSWPVTYTAQMEANGSDERFLKLHIKACHTLTNRNRSHISHDVMVRRASTIKNVPILADVQETIGADGKKEYDFSGHTIDMTEDPETGEIRSNYIERPVGVVPADAIVTLEKDGKTDREYLHVDGLIYEEHGNLAASILRRRKVVSCSVEIAVYEMSYDTNRDILTIDDFAFLGVTLLGKNVAPGMEGACAYTTFSELLDAQRDSGFAIDQSSEKGGRSMNVLEELLTQYNVSREALTFEVDGLSDDELRARFAEAFDETDESGTEPQTEPETEDEPEQGNDEPDNPETGDESSDPQEFNETGDESSEPGDQPEGDDPDVPDDNESGSAPAESDEPTTEAHEQRVYIEETQDGVLTHRFEIEMNSLRFAIQQAMSRALGKENEWGIYVAAVFMDTQTAVAEDNGTYKRCKYEIVSYDAERGAVEVNVDTPVEVYPRFLTTDEINTVNSLNNQVDELQRRVDAYQRAEQEAPLKDALMKDEQFALIHNTAQFAAIDPRAYTLDALKDELDSQLLKYAKTMKPTAEPKKKASAFVPLSFTSGPAASESDSFVDYLVNGKDSPQK